jgi:anaerobic sulfite reductase subunit A
MGYRFNRESFDRLLGELSREYNILAPVSFAGKGRFSDDESIRYAKVESSAGIVVDRKSHFSPKEAVFPVTQTLFHFAGGQVYPEPVHDRPSIVFLRPCDINGINRLDAIYLENGGLADPYYKQFRKKTKFFMIECATSFENCFCVSMKANESHDYHAAFRFGDEILSDLKDDSLRALFDRNGSSAEFAPSFVTENKINVRVPNVDKMPAAMYEDPFWDEYTSRCIACGRCTTTCVTCSCFTTRDIYYDDNARSGERRRIWASCHVDGFADMAGGHSFRKKNGQRMRFKVFHKVYDFNRRFGRQMCVGCGRCDDNCPEYISFSSAVNRLSAKLDEGGSCGA